MPPISVVPRDIQDPYAGQDVQALVDIFKSVGDAERLRRQEVLRKNILKTIAQGGEPQQMLSSIAAIIENTEPQYAGGVSGLFQRIATPFMPATSPLTDALTGRLVSDVTGHGGLQREYLQSRIDATNALTKLRKRVDSKTVKPLRSTDLSRYDKDMEEALKSSREERWGGKDWQKPELKLAWERFKQTAGYDTLGDYQRRQLWTKFKSKVQAKAKKGWFPEYEWDLTPEEEAEWSGLGAVGIGGVAVTGKAELSDEDIRDAVRKARQNLGPGATEAQLKDEVKRILSVGGL